ncbi:hypothetical protein FQF14_09270 [Escherichia coli]|nr:hypothetical protein [Escherichia coli]EFB4759784.1 hypothetical protein [Escherichia coli]
MNPLVWCLWADVAAKLRSLKRYSVFTFQRMKFMNRTSPHYFRRSVLSLLISALCGLNVPICKWLCLVHIG